MTIFEFIWAYVKYATLGWMLLNILVTCIIFGACGVLMILSALMHTGGFTKLAESFESTIDTIYKVVGLIYGIANTAYNNVFNPIRWVYFAVQLRKNIKNGSTTMKLLCQLNGVTIGNILVEDTATEDEIKKAMLENATLEPFVENNKRIVIIPNKLVNIVT